MSAVSSSTRRDVKIISLMGVAHFFSHLYQLSLPPLFTFIGADLGLSFGQLGLLVTLLYVVSGVCQPIAGILVDRFGARTLLLAGFALEAAGTACYGVFTAYPALILAAMVAGAGNSVFHPADYSIMSASISERLMGRAFSIHALGGFLGYAAGPTVIFPLALLIGWQPALIVGGLVGLAVVLVLLSQRDSLSGEARHRTRTTQQKTGILAIAMQFAIVMCFLFFVFGSMAQIGSQTFTPTALHLLYGIALPVATSALSGFLLGAPAGILVGGFMADRLPRHDLLAAAGLTAAAVCFVVVSTTELPAMPLIALFALAGLVYGSALPSRDMLVRSVTPPGASGRVFGFVYSGLDTGSALTPVIFGFLLDQGAPRAVFVLIAALFGCAIFTALAVRAKPAAEPNAAA